MVIVCVGDCGIDHYLPSNERLPGGITANFARHARDVFPASDKIQIVSCIGNDDAAELVMAPLERSGIDCQIALLDGATPVQYIAVEADGEKNFVRYDEGVLGDFVFTAKQRELIGESELLVAPVYLQIVGLFDELMAMKTRGLVSIDFADFLQHPDFRLLEAHIERIDIGFFGLTLDNQSAIDGIRELAALHEKLFVVTLGADGSRAFFRGEQFDCPAANVNEVVDTTGAGDAYAAAFLSGYAHGADIQESMQRGAALAAKVVGFVGSHRSGKEMGV
jgi:fructoselysine 6-kinase